MAADARRSQRPTRPASDPPPQAVLGLLNYLTATSLDEDYAHVSQRRSTAGGGPSSGRPANARPGVVALAALAVFGLLVTTAAVQTSRTADESASSRESLIKQVNARKKGLADRRAVVSDLRREIGTLRAGNLDATRRGRELKARLTRLGVVTGRGATHGPGISVVVDDAPGTPSVREQVQAPDLQKLVNGLWQVGAEAISVNGQRLTTLSSIRDAGEAITVNYVSLRRPYTVSAIGNPKLMGAELLDTAGGQTWVALQSTFGLQFDIDIKDDMVLPPARPVSLRSAALPEGPTNAEERR